MSHLKETKEPKFPMGVCDVDKTPHPAYTKCLGWKPVGFCDVPGGDNAHVPTPACSNWRPFSPNKTEAVKPVEPVIGSRVRVQYPREYDSGGGGGETWNGEGIVEEIRSAGKDTLYNVKMLTGNSAGKVGGWYRDRLTVLSVPVAVVTESFEPSKSHTFHYTAAPTDTLEPVLGTCDRREIPHIQMLLCHNWKPVLSGTSSTPADTTKEWMTRACVAIEELARVQKEIRDLQEQNRRTIRRAEQAEEAAAKAREALHNIRKLADEIFGG